MSTAPNLIHWLATALFALAIAHTFCTAVFERMALRHPRHAGLFHLVGEVEVVFGVWAMLLVLCIALIDGGHAAREYVDGRNFTEPMFVFAIMVVAATRPVLQVAGALVDGLSRRLPLAPPLAFTWTVLTIVPLLGSFITEPAAMTMAALMLSRRLLSRNALPSSLRYALIGTLFVNVSIGGTLTPFAAPPVLMVAGTWHWDMAHMLANFGWRSAMACVVSSTAVVLLFRASLSNSTLDTGNEDANDRAGAARVPPSLCALHLAMLAAIVLFAHEPALFIGVFLFFMGVATAYPQHQDRLILREALMVAFFLAGLVVLGGMQQWWLQPLLLGLSSDTVYWGATALTAITDNAALTYLGSLVQGLDEDFKHSLVAGAVTGGGLTVIANAPNPAGISILRAHFEDQTVNPLRLFLAALGPTLVAAAAFRLL